MRTLDVLFRGGGISRANLVRALGLNRSTTAVKTEAIAFLLIESSVGGGIVIGGKLFRGSSGLAGEFGQIVLGGEGFCRGRTRPGHLESFVGKEAVLARYQWHGADPAADIEHFLAALQAGDALALKTAEDWGQKLALGLTQVTSVLNPTSIVLGGSVAPIFNWAAADIANAMQREFIEGFPLPQVQVSALGWKARRLAARC